MTFSVSITSIEKDGVYNAVGEALVKQVGFAEAIDIAHTISTLSYHLGGEMVSVSASGHGDADSGYFSVSLGYKLKPDVVPAPVESGPLETAEGAVAAIVEPVQDSAVAS